MDSPKQAFQFDRAKFKDVVLYVCASCEPDRLGAVKLHKVLYFADMIHFVTKGVPLVGSTYRKREYGPTSDHLLPILRELERERAIEIEEIDYFGYRKKVYIAQKKPITERLSRDELALIDEIIDFVSQNNTAKTIGEFSHNRAWEKVEFGDEIPYHSAFYLFPTVVSQETIEWGAEESAAIEAEKARQRDMGYTTPADFRARLVATRRG